jgi:imidazolonepropionase-like amidohydrolase
LEVEAVESKIDTTITATISKANRAPTRPDFSNARKVLEPPSALPTLGGSMTKKSQKQGGAAAKQPTDVPTLFTNGTIFDGTGAAPFPGSVLVAGNRIVAVVPANESWDAPARAARVDLGGRTIVPGLVEGHAHISFTNMGSLMDLALTPVEEHLIAAISNAKLLLDHGFTSLVSGASMKQRLDVVVRNAINAGKIPGPRMLAASQEMTPTGNLGDLEQLHLPIPEVARVTAICDGPEAFRLAARRAAREGVDTFKVNVSGDRDWEQMGAGAESTLIDDDELAAVVKVARDRGLRVAAHATSSDSVKMCVRHGVNFVFHAAYADEEALDMLESVKDRVFVAPAVGFPYAYCHDAEEFGMKVSNERHKQLVEELEITARNMNALRRRGVRVIPGGDYGIVCTPMGRNARDLELFVKLFGFSPSEALIAATTHGGAMMGRGHELGQLQAGWLADLIVVDGDPLADITIMQDREKIQLVMKDGLIFRDELTYADRALPHWTGGTRAAAA